LYIGGAGLGRGYLGRPGLTADKFVPDPVGPEPGGRLYRTGDRVRWLADGSLEFLGRFDSQVKVRGFRIEPGEIEAGLAGHPGVAAAVVVPREDLPGGRGLVAYLVGRNGATPTTGELRAHLKERLPEYMVPAAFVTLQALPLNANGKVDRKALPAPDGSRLEPDDAFVAPRGPMETLLAVIWAELLKLPRVGVHDNFFALGGDSILCIRVIARANQAGLSITTRHLFEHPTIAELAGVAATAAPTLADQGVVTGAVPLTPIQHWFFEWDLPQRQDVIQVQQIEVRRALNLDLLEQSLAHVLAHHDALRLRFSRGPEGWQQVNAGLEAARVPLQRFDLSALPAAEQDRVLAARAAQLQAGLDISQGPLLQAGWFDRGPERAGCLLLILHHLAIDIVSWGILLEDLWSAYRQLARGQVVQLPEKTTSFQQWARRLTEYARSGALEAERAYWLDPARATVGRLPVDHAEGANTRDSVDVVRVRLDPERTQALLREVPQASQTETNEVLLTALALAFGRWTGQRRLLVDVEGHGREEIFPGVNLTRTVGWFTVIAPVLLDPGQPARADEALRAIKEQWRALPNRGIGYGLLRYLSGDEALAEQLRALPAPEVVFNYAGQSGGPARKAEGEAAVAAAVVPSHAWRFSGPRKHLLEISGSVSAGRLQFRLTYSRNRHERHTVERLAAELGRALEEVIDHCLSSDGSYTPADFPEAGATQADLDTLMSQIRGQER
jgi:non-ribosomal peptide synthase protein (TIGR01720 family)